MWGGETNDSDILNLFSPSSVLKEYMYGTQEAHEARNSNRPLAIRLEKNKSCNLCCLYCYAQSSEDSAKTADFNNIKRIIMEAKEFGDRVRN